MSAVDTHHTIRKKIIEASSDMRSQQLARDERYAVAGSFYSMFRAIMEAKSRIPLVLLADLPDHPESFPVILPVIAEINLKFRLESILNLMLKNMREERMATDTNGMSVSELSAEDMPRYFDDDPNLPEHG
jgi:hypothetical protein